jgi:SNF2 family DNA or RNA helicase
VAALTLRPYQTLALQWIQERERSAVWAAPGMGKTVSGLVYLDGLHNLWGEGRPSLVLAPARVARSVWPREAKKWEGLSLDVRPIIGSPAQREALLREDFPVHVVNYELLPWLRTWWGKRWPYATVIADESTRLKSFRAHGGGRRAAALRGAAFSRVERWINLTGTPAPNGLVDLWGQSWFLDKGERLGATFKAFEERWFNCIRGQNPHEIRRIPTPWAEDEIHEKLADLCLTIDPKDWFDLREPICTRVDVDLPAKARIKYDEFQKELFTVLESGAELEAPNVGAKLTRCLQLANGAVYTSRECNQWEVVHDEKLDALESIVEESGGSPLLVVYQFKSDAARLRKRFPQSRILDREPETEDAWNAGKIPMLLVQPQSSGHGLNLQDGGHHIVYFGHTWDLEMRDQVLERIGPVRQLQSGYDRPVFVYDIVARNTVDEMVIAALAKKTTVQQALLEYMKRGVIR